MTTFRILAICVATLLGLALDSDSIFAQRRGIQIGGPNGIVLGGGRGLRIGGRNGVQAGGGEGLRFGPPGIGVQYGGGQGVRFGTRNFGVQYGGGQILRYGTPNYGVRIGGGGGVRIGSPTSGVQIGGGRGFQVGRIDGAVTQPLPPATLQRNNIPATAVPAATAPATAPGYVPPIVPAQPSPNAPSVQPRDRSILNVPIVPGNAPTESAPATRPGQSILLNTSDQPAVSSLNRYQLPGRQFNRAPTLTTDSGGAVYVQSSAFLQGTGPGQIVLSTTNLKDKPLTIKANGTDFELIPGKAAYFSAATPWNFEFNNGEVVSNFRIDRPGNYAVDKNDQGWTLVGAGAPTRTQKPQKTTSRLEGQSTGRSVATLNQPVKRLMPRKDLTISKSSDDSTGASILETPVSSGEKPTLDLEGNLIEASNAENAGNSILKFDKD